MNEETQNLIVIMMNKLSEVDKVVELIQTDIQVLERRIDKIVEALALERLRDE